MSRLVVVSNRVDLPPGDTAPGGLAISLAATIRHTNSLWIGWSGQVGSSSDVPRRHNQNGIEYAVVDLSIDDYQHYYLGFCNRVLWPLSHGQLPDPDAKGGAWYRAYRRVNFRMANQIRGSLKHDDVLWVHDYHLLPLGHFLRQAGCRNPIGHFLHVPFPALADGPVSRELLGNLLAYDLLGFQTPNDLAAFEAVACRHWGEHAVTPAGVANGQGGLTATGVFPLGVDIDYLRRTASAKMREAALRWWSVGQPGPRVIGADRLDISKALPQRLRAYRQLLTNWPARPRPNYLQFISPSRLALDAHRELQESIRREADLSNSSSDLRCVFAAVPHDELMGILASADVGLVTPRADGMNLLAKEFVAVQPEEDPGVLVLSRGAGAAVELEAAILVPADDQNSLAEGLRLALEMPLTERRSRHQSLLRALRRNELPRWQQRFVGRLLQARRPGLAIRPGGGLCDADLA